MIHARVCIIRKQCQKRKKRLLRKFEISNRKMKYKQKILLRFYGSEDRISHAQYLV